MEIEALTCDFSLLSFCAPNPHFKFLDRGKEVSYEAFFESIDFISASVIGADLSLVLATGSERWNFEGFLLFQSNKAWCEEETGPPPLKCNKLPK